MKKIILPCFLLLSMLACSQHDSSDSANPGQSLFKAISSGKSAVVKVAIMKGANLNDRCTIKGDVNECFIKDYKNECLDYETEYYTKEKVMSEFGEESLTPLYLAAKLRKADIVGMLLDGGADAKLPSNVCRIICEGECHPYMEEASAYSVVFYAHEPDDATLQTALAFAKKGVFSELYNINDLVTNEKISDQLLSDFIKQMMEVGGLNLRTINNVDMVDEKALSTLDQAVKAKKTKTAATLKAAGAQGVKSFEPEGTCEELYGDSSSGPIYKVYYEDGAEGKVEACDFEGT